MDAFENIVAEIFWREGYWVKKSFKVDLTKDQKRLLGKPSMPRPEIDILAYSGRDNLVWVVECKSFIDSVGVLTTSFGPDAKHQRYKLFTRLDLQATVFDCIRKQLNATGACPPDVRIKLGLACGRIPSDSERSKLRQYFAEREWELFDDIWIENKVAQLARTGYENEVATVVAKLLRNKQQRQTR